MTRAKIAATPGEGADDNCSLAEEMRRLVSTAVTSGVTSYPAIAKVAGRSRSLAKQWGDPASDANLPAFVLAALPALGAFVTPWLEEQARRVLAGKPHATGAEDSANVVLGRVAAWMTALVDAMADRVITADEARGLLKTAAALRVALDQLVTELQDRAGRQATGGVA